MQSKDKFGADSFEGFDLGPKQLLENSPVASYTCDAEGKLTWFNEAAVQLWGRKPVLYKEFWCGSWKIFYPDGSLMVQEDYPVARVLKTGKEEGKSEIRIQRPDGLYKFLLVFPKPIFDKEGKLSGAFNTLIDITDLKADHVKKETLSAIVESSDNAIISKDLSGRITSWNPGAERIFGYSEAEALGQPITMLIPTYLLEQEKEIIANIKNGVRMDIIETRRLTREGKEIPVSLAVSPVKDIFGRIVGASKVAQDISEKLLGEEKQAILSAIVESSDDAIVSKNLKGIIMSWNRGAEEIFGYSEAEVLGKSITLLIPEERLHEEEVILEKISNGIKIQHFETIRKHKTGREIPVSITISPVKDSRGKIIGASKVARDITQQKESQAAMQKYIQNLETLNSVGKSISENLDVQEILQRVTDATTNLTGAAFGAFFYNNTGLVGDTFRLFTLSGAPRKAFEGMPMPRHTDLFHPTFIDKKVVRIDDVTKHVDFGKNSPFMGMPKGHFSVVSYLAVPVVSKSGGVIGGLLYGHPEAGVFTEEHELLVVNIAAQAAVSLDNSRLFEQVKSLSDKKDEFIALASHELKTPLTTIKGYLQVLTKKESDKMSQLFLGKSLYQVEKLNTLVEDLLNMSRIESGQLDFSLEVFDLREMLGEIVETFSYLAGSHKVVAKLGRQKAVVKADRQRIEQAILNLMTNAIKYSPNADEIYLSLEVAEENTVLRVRDYGIGLTAQQRQQLFTRFYRAESTKGISGLGLGLYLTKQIIDRHNGRIEVHSEFGKGSEFALSLPLEKKKLKKTKMM
ncbi:PAS domain S-box protein [Salinimicrobium sp. HB62]|uniref:PAS domain S-box protein n=1 Tax=Salinimicrobium sp. HB62 TaxID=3077781 RepID=UPI002D7A0EF3|nr:PAS domain S-box protein [Salinimicrobium sp. HB62]